MAPTIRACGRALMMAPLGLTAALGANPGWALSLARAHAALPDPFPAGAAAESGATAPALCYRLTRNAERDSRYSFPGWVARRRGYRLQGASLLCGAEPPGRDLAPSLVITVGVRSGDYFEEVGVYDSRKQQTRPGVPFDLTGQVDVALLEDQVVDVLAVQGGWPQAPLTGSTVMLHMADEGG